MIRLRTLALTTAAMFGATLVAGTVSAQQPPAPTGAHGPRGHMPATREEATAKADQMFARLDTNRDGKVTQAEFAAARDARRERRDARRKAAGKTGERMFARADTDRDGSVDQAEHRATALARFQRIDTNGDGRIDDAERAAMREKRMSRRAARTGATTESPNGE